MRSLTKIISSLLSVVMASALFVACGEPAPDGAVTVDFWYSASISENKVIREMVDTYNKGQGKEDGVYVKPDNRQNIDRSSLFVDAPNILVVEDEMFKTWAVEDLYLDLSEYFETMPGEYTEENIPSSLTERFRFDVADNADGKRMAGKDADLQGLPFGSTAMVYYYSKSAFEAYGINVISAEEEKLSELYPDVLPHGYAEYKEAPFDGAKASKNLAGEQVYKVFNNRIPMNWEEFRYLSKCFTQKYNSSSPTELGSATHWWFSYGWSVGGDCIGYNGEKYEFTVADKTPNYLVVAPEGITVNDRQYSAGEIIHYEDKIKTEDISSIDGVYELPSQYEALLEFVRLSVPSDKEADSGYKGYGIGSAAGDDNSAGILAKNDVAIVAADGTQLSSADVAYKDKYDLAPATQYREYVGGSVYYKGEETFDNEYLKVIGETYDGAEYTGELASENGTPLVGEYAAFSGSDALVIPRRSDESKYEAAWKFIRWAAGSEGQAIYQKTGRVPNQTDLAYSEEFLSQSTLNYWAFSNSVEHGDIGDWAYFENGEWVSDWSELFNNQLRVGIYSISDFMDKKADEANEAIGDVKIVLNGRR